MAKKKKTLKMRIKVDFFFFNLQHKILPTIISLKGSNIGPLKTVDPMSMCIAGPFGLSSMLHDAATNQVWEYSAEYK